MLGRIRVTTVAAFLGGVVVAAVHFLWIDRPARPAGSEGSGPPAVLATSVPTLTAPEPVSPADSAPAPPPVEIRPAAPRVPAVRDRSSGRGTNTGAVRSVTQPVTPPPAATPAVAADTGAAPPPAPLADPGPGISVLGQAAEAVTVAPKPPSAGLDNPPPALERPGILRPDALEQQRAREARTPATVTLAAGTVLNVRLNQTLSSERHQPGDSFSGTLDQPLVVDGMVIAERGARVDGQVLRSDRGGRAAGRAFLSVRLVTLHTSDDQRVAILTDEFRREAEGTLKSDATKVAIGAGLGAALGAILGGGKGAAIGAGVGGAGSAGGVLLTRGKPAEIPVETRIAFRLREPVTLTEKID